MATTVTPPTPSAAENLPADGESFSDLLGLGSEPEEVGGAVPPEPAPTPEPTPSVPVAAEPPASATTTPIGVQEVQPPPAQAPIPPPVEQVPVATPVAQPATPPVAVPPVPPTQPPPVQAQPPAPSQPPYVPPTQEEVLQRRQALIDDIAGRYSFSEEDKAALAVEPEKVLPKIAGRLYVDVYEAVLQASLAQLPQLINGYNQVQQVAQRHEQAFYDKWPALRKPEYEQPIKQIAAMYRRMNPQASADDMMSAVGVMATVHLGLGPQVPVAPTPPTAIPQSSPVQPPASAAPRPFAPAGVGGTNAPPAAATPGPFDDLLAPDRYED